MPSDHNLGDDLEDFEMKGHEDLGEIIWRKLSCPFCQKTLVEGYDWDDLPEEILGSGDEPIIDYSFCEHVAFFRSWGIEDGRFVGPYGKILGQSKEEDGACPEERVTDLLDFPLDSNEIRIAEQALNATLKLHEIRIEVDYFGTGGGPKGDEVMECLFVLVREK